MTEFVGPGQFPYDDGTALPFGPTNQQALAETINQISGSGIGYAANNAARAALVSNNQAFVGLHVYDAEDDIVYRYSAASTWIVAESTGPVNVATFTTNWTAGAVPNTPRISQANGVCHLEGVAANSSTSYGNVMTIPSQFQPPTATARAVGVALLTTGTAASITFRAILTAGVISLANPSATPAAGNVEFHLNWFMD